MRLAVIFTLLVVVALAGHIPGLRNYYPQDMIPQSRFSRKDFVGQEVIENDQSFICPESVLETFTNGSCHNTRFPFLGSSNTIEIRLGEPLFTDGRGEVDEEKVSARLVSNVIGDAPNGLDTNLKDTTRLLIFLGQFIDHDFALTLEQNEEGDGETLPIEVPEDDDEFDEDEIEFFRSEFIRVDQIREFESINTPWLDMGNVYGDTQERTEMLRLLEGGLLNTTIINDREFPPLQTDGLFFCGDIRCEENPQLFAFHTLFLREHNRIANAYQAMVPDATDEEVFQFARLLNINQYQSIIFDFYLPYLLGRRTFPELAGEYRGFVEGTDPTISVAFASAVYRYGHSGVPNELRFRDIDNDQVRTDLALAEAFLNVESVLEEPDRMPAIFLGQSLVAHDLLDNFFNNAIRNDLFRNMPDNINAESGFDLIARNIQRCRDHGCGSLNDYRYLFGLDPYECDEDDQLDCFRQLTGEEEIAELLDDLYEDFDDCDLFICGMSEQNYEDSLLGETFTVLLTDQFRRLRDGDRIWYELIYEEEFDPDFLASLNIIFPSRLSDVIINNLAEDLPGTEDLLNTMLLSPSYVAMVTSDTIQIEWAEEGELRNNLEEIEITVEFPNGTSTTLEGDVDEQYVLFTGLEANAEHTFVVEGTRLDNSQQVQLGDEITVSTLIAEEVVEEGDGLIAGLEPAVFGGIIGGVAGGIILISGIVCCIKRRNRFKNDDINAQFF